MQPLPHRAIIPLHQVIDNRPVSNRACPVQVSTQSTAQTRHAMVSARLADGNSSQDATRFGQTPPPGSMDLCP
eukprot:12570977-Heterocapsa_arctica.AAC.1